MSPLTQGLNYRSACDRQESPADAMVNARQWSHVANAFEVRQRTFVIEVEFIAVQGHPRPPAIDLGANRKPVCNFLLVINSNFGRISYRFRDIDA